MPEDNGALLGEKIAELKSRIEALSQNIIRGEQKTLFLIKKEISLEESLVGVLEKMFRAEKSKVRDTEVTSKKHEAALKARIERLQKKRGDYEKKKEAVKHIKAKQVSIRKELGFLEDKITSDTSELYGIKKAKDGAAKKGIPEKARAKKIIALKQRIKATKKQMKKVKRIAEFQAGKLRKKSKLKKKEIELPVAPKPKLPKPKPIKPKHIRKPKPKPKQKIKPLKEPKPKPEKPAEIEEPKEPELEEQEKPEFEEKPEEFEEKKQELEREIEPVKVLEAPEEKEVPEEKLEEIEPEEKPFEPKKIGRDTELETGELEDLEKNLERIGRKAKPGEEPLEPELMGPSFGPGKKILEYRDNEIALLYPNWQASFGTGTDSLVAVSKEPFEFVFTRNSFSGKSIQGIVAKESAKISENPNAKVHINKQTGDNVYLEYSEEKQGTQFLTKALFILYKKKVYKIAFTGPADQFSQIEDIFLKTAFSVQTF